MSKVKSRMERIYSRISLDDVAKICAGFAESGIDRLKAEFGWAVTP